jgi:hypothetical protein
MVWERVILQTLRAAAPSRVLSALHCCCPLFANPLFQHDAGRPRLVFAEVSDRTMQGPSGFPAYMPHAWRYC